MKVIDQKLAALVNSVVARTMRRAPWMNEDDVRSEAWIAALEARRRFDPGMNRPIAAYARRALETTISRHVIRFSSPVSASDRQRHSLIGIMPGTLPDEIPDEVGPEKKRWFKLVALRLHEVLSVAQLDAAIRYHCPPERKRKKIQHAPELALASEAVETIINDEELQRLWKERA